MKSCSTEPYIDPDDERRMMALVEDARANGGSLCLKTVRDVRLVQHQVNNPRWNATFNRTMDRAYMLHVSPDEVEQDAPVDHWMEAINTAAMTLCGTSYGRTPPDGYACVCLKDGRTPDKSIPRCRVVIDAVEVVAPILMRLGMPIG